MRRIEQERPCEAQMKKPEKGDEKIFDLTASLHRAESSQKFIQLQSFGDIFCVFFSFATWPAVRRGPSLTVMFPTGKVGARGHFSNCYYQASAGEYILSWVPSSLLAQGPCSSSVLLTAPVPCFMSFLLMACACPWTQDISIVCHLHLVTFPQSNTAIYHSHWDYIGPGYII